VSGLFASYRKDAWLPEADYNEVGTRPVNGGRFHIAGISAVTGRVTGLRLNGQDADSLLPQVDKLEWYHVWPQQVVAGQPVWVAFHSRNPAWDTASSATIRVTTSAGDALDGTFTVATTPVPLTYVTTADQGQTLLIHAHNDDSVPHTLSRLLVNGRDVTGPGLACVAEPTIAPGASVLWVVPRCTASLPGDAWTVVAEYVGAPAAVGVGRVLPEHFGIEAWPYSRDCVWPRDLAVHQAGGFDTLFTRWGGYCGSSGESLVNTGLLADAGFASLLTHDFLTDNNPGQAITNQAAVAGLFIGDEFAA
jgi:hypothetical protein